jgi:hypothetical protein
MVCFDSAGCQERGISNELLMNAIIDHSSQGGAGVSLERWSCGRGIVHSVGRQIEQSGKEYLRAHQINNGRKKSIKERTGIGGIVHIVRRHIRAKPLRAVTWLHVGLLRRNCTKVSGLSMTALRNHSD